MNPSIPRRALPSGHDLEYRDRTGALDEEVIYATGDSVVPNSVYHVVLMAPSCQGHETTCLALSESLELTQAWWGDVNGDGSVMRAIELRSAPIKEKAVYRVGR